MRAALMHGPNGGSAVKHSAHGHMCDRDMEDRLEARKGMYLRWCGETFVRYDQS